MRIIKKQQDLVVLRHSGALPTALLDQVEDYFLPTVSVSIRILSYRCSTLNCPLNKISRLWPFILCISLSLFFASLCFNINM
ncbi:hypothetical protein ASG93_31430 [Paenibacillus sp. Soil787]|nr:hypothetical protein ASG93_31430 [Paenibacillus sp. Soil787]